MQRVTPDAGFRIEHPGSPSERDRALDVKFPRTTRVEDPLLNGSSVVFMGGFVGSGRVRLVVGPAYVASLLVRATLRYRSLR